MRHPLAPLAMAGAILALASAPALAQSSLGIGAAEPAVGGGSFGWIDAWQKAFYRNLSEALGAMRDDAGNLWPLIGLSFAYGVFHAAGPGHGKAVISSYIIANERSLRRGIVISFLAAFLQGAVAIAVAGLAYAALRGTGISMTRTAGWLEVASYALIAGFGGWLLAGKLGVFRRPRPPVAHAHPSGPDEECASCAHVPDPARLAADRLDRREAVSVIFAMGLRPCSGALVILAFAAIHGLLLGGVLSVAAMALGTAITVSSLAMLAVTGKNVAIRFAGGGSAASRVGRGIEIAGAGLVLALGLSLLTAALRT